MLHDSVYYSASYSVKKKKKKFSLYSLNYRAGLLVRVVYKDFLIILKKALHYPLSTFEITLQMKAKRQYMSDYLTRLFLKRFYVQNATIRTSVFRIIKTGSIALSLV